MISNNIPNDPRSELIQLLNKLVDADSLFVSDFANFFVQKEYEQDEYFLRKGQPVARIGFLTSGVMRTFATDNSGEEFNINMVDEGSFVLGSFIPEKISGVNIQCIAPAVVLAADFNKVIEFLETHQKLKSFFYNYLSAAHNRIQYRLTQYLRLDAKGRYLAFLDEFPNLMNRIPHYHVANYLGISSTQLSRIRNKLAKT